MKKVIFVFVLGSFLGLALNANACDGHKAKAKKASTSTVTAPTTATAAPVAKDGKKECTPEERAACIDKAAKAGCESSVTTTSAEAPKSSKDCCAKKAPTKKS